MAKNILVFTGNGKGKSTAAFGMALRATGHGQRILILQFMKSDNTTGELASCRTLGIEVRQTGLGFVPKPDNPAWQKHRDAAQTGFAQARAALQRSDYDLLILDEICGAVAHDLVEEEALLESLRQSSDKVNIVLTGRGATAAMIALADTVSEMVPHKHALEQGVPAREGIEY